MGFYVSQFVPVQFEGRFILNSAVIDDELIKKLISASKEAAKNAYAPYSRYGVGAAVLTAEGKIYTGCNIENASYGLTICAERVAIFNAVSRGHRKIVAVAVYADGNMPYPCGACRQVISEFGEEDTVVIVSNGKKTEKFSLGELLPKRFRL